MSTTPTHLEPNAPLRQLVRKLHQGRTLAQNVVRLRYKRRKPKPVEVPPTIELNQTDPWEDVLDISTLEQADFLSREAEETP